jgi:Tol biopolymer transport system component
MRRLVALQTLIGMALWTLAAISEPAARATVPDKNGRIAFAADLGLGAEIFTIKRNGGDFRQITELDGNAEHPDWSFDGARIVFNLEDRGLYIMRSDGSHLHQIAPRGGLPSFTPDGHHVVYECGGGRCGTDGVYLMRANSSDFPGTRLSTNPFPYEGDSDPQVSPDGRTVTFVRHKVDGELQALFGVNIDGSDLRKLTPYTYEVGIKHDWAPDGEHIVITLYADSPNGRNPNVATIDSDDGSDLKLLTSLHRGSLGAYAGSYSPDGRWIVFRLQNPDRGIFELIKMHPDGSDRTLIGRYPFSPRFIDWGPQPAK